MMDVPYSLTATIRNVDEKTAWLAFSPASNSSVGEQGPKDIPWPKELLPPGIGAGDTVTVQLLTEGQRLAQRHEQARLLLSELLGGPT